MDGTQDPTDNPTHGEKQKVESQQWLFPCHILACAHCKNLAKWSTACCGPVRDKIITPFLMIANSKLTQPQNQSLQHSPLPKQNTKIETNNQTQSWMYRLLHSLHAVAVQEAPVQSVEMGQSLVLHLLILLGSLLRPFDWSLRQASDQHLFDLLLEVLGVLLLDSNLAAWESLAVWWGIFGSPEHGADLESRGAKVPDFLDVGESTLKVVALKLEVVLVGLWLGRHDVWTDGSVQLLGVGWLSVDGSALGGEIRSRGRTTAD